MDVGVAYYPEHEEKSQWSVDLQHMKGAGIEYVRIAEFAWTVMEPSEGGYQWQWLDDFIELAQLYHIGVVLCTPTACPPVWLVEKYPDILPVHKSGEIVSFGARQHRSYYSENYWKYSAAIVEAMAQRYGKHPNVIAWQLDNEFAGETKFDYSEGAKQAFHQYLKERYNTIEELNQSWGTTFWSQRYERFDQIPLPKPIQSDVRMWQHPSLELTFAQFSSQGIVKYSNMQADILRKYIEQRPITTNVFMFRWGDSLDWYQLFQQLDVVGMDIYSDKDYEIAFYCDACTAVLQRPFWMMEFGTGDVNLYEHMQLASKHHCDKFFLFKYKPFPWGQEQGNGQPELMTITGQPAASYQKVKLFTDEANRIMTSRITTDHNGKNRIGLYYDFNSSWAYRISVSNGVSYADGIVDTIYKALYNIDAKIDIMFHPSMIKQQRCIILYRQWIYNRELEAALIHYVQQGGMLIATSDLFRKNEDNVFLTSVPSIYREVFGWKDNDFIYEEEELVVQQHTNENGGAGILVKSSVSYEDWSNWLENELLQDKTASHL